MKKYDVVIAGAGASGLLCARILSHAGLSVGIVEARDRPGGRVHTIKETFATPVEGGAEFIHGNMQITFRLLEEFGLGTRKRKGRMIRISRNEAEKQKDFIADSKMLEDKLSKVTDDISIAQFLKLHLSGDENARLRKSLQQFVEGYDAADINRSSTIAFRDEWMNGDEEQFIIEEGYSALINCLFDSCREKECDFHFNAPVSRIEWFRDNIKAVAGDDDFYAEKIIVTVPPTLLMMNKIDFDPPVDEYISQMKQLGFGSVIKVLLEFDNAFWQTMNIDDQSLKDLGWLFTDEAIPTWWTQYPEEGTLLTGWLGGPTVDKYKDASENFIIKKALQSLSNIFKIPLQELRSMCRTSAALNWQKNPFSHCAYSYDSLTSDRAKLILREPIEDTIYFAGEALSKGNTGTVEAAFESASHVAERILVLHRA